MLLERQDEFAAADDALAGALDNHKTAIEDTQKLLLKTVQRMTKLEEWRMEHIEQDMLRRSREEKERRLRLQMQLERIDRIRRIRMVFNCLGLFFGLLFLGAAGGVTRETIQMVPGVILMVGFGVISGVCFCKGGVFDC